MLGNKFVVNKKRVVKGKFLGCSMGHKAVVFKRGFKKFKNAKGETMTFEAGYVGKCAGCKTPIDARKVLESK